VITEIAIVAFFFAMRSCETTTTAKRGRTRITDLDGVTFRDKKNCIIPHTSARLPNAYRVTVAFADQKNRKKNDKRTQKKSEDTVLEPVRCLASLVKRILETVPDACGTTTINTMLKLITEIFVDNGSIGSGLNRRWQRSISKLLSTETLS
jgi:hypothetical protein